MISGNPIPTQPGLGATQDDPISSGAGCWNGRTVKVLAAVTCLVSGVIAVATLATGFYVVGAVFGAICVVSGLTLLFGNSKNAVDTSEFDSQSLSDDYDEEAVYPGRTLSERYQDIFSHYQLYRNPSAPVTTMRSERVNESPNVSPDNGLRPGPVHLQMCKQELRRGQIAANGLLGQILINITAKGSPDLTDPRNKLDILKTKEPFDDDMFLELAKLLGADQPVIVGHQRIDKSKKIELLERLIRQPKELLEVQQKQALSLMAESQTIKQNLEIYAPKDRLSRLPDPVSDIEIATMKEHVDAFDTLLSRIGRSSLNQMIHADHDMQDSMSRAVKAVQECKNILNRTNRKELS